MSLRAKHQQAIKSKDFYTSKIDCIIHTLTETEKQLDSCVWHTNQIKDVVIAQAKLLDSKSLAEKLSLPLYGLSIGAKDLFCIKGMKTTAGSKILEDFISPYTSTLIDQIQSKGGLITGKTSMDEFAMGSFTNTSYLGKTSIPSHLDYSPGGSSGGSSAALFADLFDFTIGSDTGGSIRQPAAFCGLVGYKPSYGAFSRYGMISYASSLDQAGFLTKTTEDLEYLIESISLDKDSKDPTSTGLKLDYSETKISQLTFSYFEDLLDSEFIDPIIKISYQSILDKLKSIGIKLKPIKIDLLTQAAKIYYIIACAEASSNLARYQGIYFGKSLTDYSSQIKHTDFWDLVSQYRSDYFGSEVKKRIILGSYVLSSQNHQAIYQKAMRLRALLSEQIYNVFDSANYLILPTFPSTTLKWDQIHNMSSAQIYLADYMTTGFSLSGSPVVTIPSSSKFDITSTTGFQIVGAKYSDYQLIKDVKLIDTLIQEQ